MFDELHGRSVLITGASTGIGAAVAKGFGRFGARVGVHFHRSRAAAEEVAAEVRALGGEAVTLQADVTVPTELARAIDRHVQAYGGPEVLINNAGDLVRRTAFADLADETIDRIIDLNARSVVTACRLALPHLMRAGKASIINTTSLAARQTGGPGSGIYTASKAFAQGLTRYLAREYAGRGVRVNAVAPGPILTPLQERSTTPEQLAAIQSAIPMGRLGLPEDCVGAYLFLACESLSGFITGATIDVNGGAYLG